jgi:cell fate (sporulation/competence/biofilm development) regulator YlbF (YheA/YmcA/DUF963 family)
MLNSDILGYANLISEKIVNTKEYKDYRLAFEYIRSNPELYKQVKRLKKMHEEFSVHRNENRATFEEERFVAQEFYKLMLDKRVEDYFMYEHKIVALISEVYGIVAQKCSIEIFIGD